MEQEKNIEVSGQTAEELAVTGQTSEIAAKESQPCMSSEEFDMLKVDLNEFLKEDEVVKTARGILEDNRKEIVKKLDEIAKDCFKINSCETGRLSIEKLDQLTTAESEEKAKFWNGAVEVINKYLETIECGLFVVVVDGGYESKMQNNRNNVMWSCTVLVGSSDIDMRQAAIFGSTECKRRVLKIVDVNPIINWIKVDITMDGMEGERISKNVGWIDRTTIEEDKDYKTWLYDIASQVYAQMFAGDLLSVKAWDVYENDFVEIAKLKNDGTIVMCDDEKVWNIGHRCFVDGEGDAEEE